MRLFDLFFKKKSSEVVAPDETVVYDKMDYHFEAAYEEYKRMYCITDELTDKQMSEVGRYAANHIGLILTWIFEHDFYPHDCEMEYIEQVKNGTYLGVDFFLECCDGKFYSDDFSPAIRGFIIEYYKNDYLKDYAEWLQEIGYLPYEVIITFEEYQGLRFVLDRAYEDYLKNKKRHKLR